MTTHAELVARAVFAVRHLGPGSKADEHLRAALARWAERPDAGLDLEALASAARALRRRAEPEAHLWADLLAAIASGDEERILVARYAAGESSQALARELGVSDTSVLARLNRRGAPIRRQGGARHSVTTRDAAVEMYARGASARSVAEHYDTAKNVVLAWVREAGVEVRSPRGPRTTRGRSV